MFLSFPFRKHCFPVSFCFQDANYAYATRQEVLTKIRACEQLQKICDNEQASTHLIFASNSSKGQILRALSNWMGPLDTDIKTHLNDKTLWKATLNSKQPTHEKLHEFYYTPWNMQSLGRFFVTLLFPMPVSGFFGDKRWVTANT